eukprot:sb/3475802/
MFVVDTKYHAQLIQLLKGIPGRVYDMSTTKWHLPINVHDQFLEKARALRPQVQVHPLPKFVVTSLGLFQSEAAEISDSNSLKEKLLSFQKTGVEFVLSLGGRAMIADDMGLGKTIQVRELRMF